MLLFQKSFHQGLVSGAITLTIRQWAKPHVKVGGRYRVHPIGVVQVDAVEQVPFSTLGDDDARRAGFESRDALVAWMTPVAREPLEDHSLVWKVGLRHAGQDDRIDAALDTTLDAAALATLAARLARLDAGPDGPWVRTVLELIAQRPRVAASKLAASLGRETLPFKVDVRKLKRLGLTMSFEVGYEVSPRGRAFLASGATWAAPEKRVVNRAKAAAKKPRAKTKTKATLKPAGKRPTKRRAR